MKMKAHRLALRCFPQALSPDDAPQAGEHDRREVGLILSRPLMNPILG
jgi:hypothetical protein